MQTAGTVEFDFPREKSSELGWCGGKSLAEARLRSLIPLPCAKPCAKGEQNRAEKSYGAPASSVSSVPRDQVCVCVWFCALPHQHHRNHASRSLVAACVLQGERSSFFYLVKKRGRLRASLVAPVALYPQQSCSRWSAVLSGSCWGTIISAIRGLRSSCGCVARSFEVAAVIRL